RSFNQAVQRHLASLSSLLQGFSEKASLPNSVLQPPQSCVKLEFFLLPVEGHWQVTELVYNSFFLPLKYLSESGHQLQ
ncbi:hypothetical protein Q0M12_14185, partial [Staphylococcus aureus]|nr:hypothetical protein [Staphylococcus aureus]